MYPQPVAARQLVTLPAFQALVGLAFIEKLLFVTVRYCTHQLQLAKYGFRGEPVSCPALEPIRSYMPQPPGGPDSISIALPRAWPTLTAAVAALVRAHEFLPAQD